VSGGFFSSRWVQRPPHVDVFDENGAALPAAFRAGAAAAGLKHDGALDVGLLVCDAPDAVSAARFTRSGILAAPVLVTQDARLDALRVVAANSGNANAATGAEGIETALAMQEAAGAAAGVPADRVAVASTGVIGVTLDADLVAAGLARAGQVLRADGASDLTKAIMTTDAFPKRASLTVALPSGNVRLCGQAKGAGMIEPAFATMLCFVQTDAALAPETADLLLGGCVKRSFDRISVDGQLSTNDTAIFICSGASGVRVHPESEEELRFGEALNALLRMLAIMILRDGEGAERIGRVVVRGGNSDDGERCARAVANSPLIKTALHGADPNWGRIAQATGAAVGPARSDLTPLAVDIAIEGVTVCAHGAAVAHDEDALRAAVAGVEVEYEVWLGRDRADAAKTEVFFSDLSHEYVTINAEYTS
jgi:glutamate N-acetyltransferase/amino-acid N-acetyltransferase